MARDPDFIFFATMGDEAAAKAHIENLLAQEGWRELTAVREGNWVFLPRDLFHFKPNARWAQAYGYLAKLLYPELN
jgi:iron complex transport system substrate-binding protein